MCNNLIFSELNLYREKNTSKTIKRSALLLYFVMIQLLSFSSTGLFAQQQVTRIDGTKITADSLNYYLPVLIRKAKVEGLGITIFNQNHIVYKNAFGYSRADQKKPLKSTTNIYGASLSKSVFAVLVMKLVEQGKLNLDKPLQEYLPKG